MNDSVFQNLLPALRKPSAYAHAVGKIEVIETHISYVLLTGDYAYKIKKPVNLGFLDFSTLEKRRFFCAEEMRLNRRLAPEIYLDVVAIGGSPEHPAVGGSGPVLEYAVKMRQFPQHALLDRLLADAALTPAHIDLLAQEIAAFHHGIPPVAADSPFGGPENIRQPAWENFQQIRPLLQHEADIVRLNSLQGWTENEYAACEAAFAARKREGFVRECHGDMHLGNMTLLDGKITVFDCIEFNPNLRWIDVMSEAAFLMMDLFARGREDYARRFLNAYLQLTGDYAGLGILRFYLVYRSLVRAKVTCIRAAQPGLGAAEKDEALGQYRRYAALAEHFSAARRCALILTHGLSGSGKSTVTQPLLEAIDAVRLRSDVERKRLFALPPQAKSDCAVGSGLYTRDAGRRTYAHLARTAEAILRAGYPVIVDATFLARIQRDRFRQIAQRLRVPFAILDVRASEGELRRRIAARQREAQDASEADLKVLQHQIITAQALAEEESGAVIAVETEHPGELENAIAAIRERLAPC